MKAMGWVLFLVALATGAFIYLTRPPKIVEKSLEESEKDGTLIARYWLDQAKKDNLDNMKQACAGVAVNQSDQILEAIQKAENTHGMEFQNYTLLSLGGGNALKALLYGPEGSGIIMQLTLTMRQEQGKWRVSQISEE